MLRNGRDVAVPDRCQAVHSCDCHPIYSMFYILLIGSLLTLCVPFIIMQCVNVTCVPCIILQCVNVTLCVPCIILQCVDTNEMHNS